MRGIYPSLSTTAMTFSIVWWPEPTRNNNLGDHLVEGSWKQVWNGADWEGGDQRIENGDKRFIGWFENLTNSRLAIKGEG